MEKPYELEAVDALVTRSLQHSFDVGIAESVDHPLRAEGLAVRILSINSETSSSDESWLLTAGFRLAMKLCCRVLADPFRMHRGGVRRDVNSVLTWLDHRRRDGL